MAHSYSYYCCWRFEFQDAAGTMGSPRLARVISDVTITAIANIIILYPTILLCIKKMWVVIYFYLAEHEIFFNSVYLS